MGELTFFLGLQVKQKQDDIFISQDKYVAKILKKFGFSEVKTASTSMETSKPLLKDEDVQEVSPKVSHLHAVNKIFRYLKGQPKLGLWKSTTGGCHFLGCRLISWQCKKQIVVANSITEVKEYSKKDKIGSKLDKNGKRGEAGEKFKAVTVDRARKTEQNAKRRAENANTIKSYSKFKRKKEKGLNLKLCERYMKRT
nr:hypothetical protein [Tanacetum cinerariifolium]